ncbi:hypothetical protein IAR50_006259 [Cryptococcus sp. DSM 104548]
MPCTRHARPIAIDSLQSLPPELIAPIYDYVFDPAFCCPGHFVNVLRTSKEYYTSNIGRLYKVVSLNDHNCEAFLDGWQEPRGEGSRLNVDSWDCATCSQTFYHYEESAPPTDNIPLSFHPESRRVLLWRYCRSLRLNSVTAVRMTALASDRLDTEWTKFKTERAPLDDNDPDYYLYTGYTIPSNTHPLFPSLTRISFALSVMQELYNHPEQIPDASGEISIRSAMSALMGRLKTGAAVCMRFPDTARGHEEIVDEDERRDVLYAKRTRFTMVVYDIIALSHSQPSRLVFHGVHPADLKRRVFRTSSFEICFKNKGNLETEEMGQVKEWCKDFFRTLSVERMVGCPTRVHISNCTSHPMSFGCAAQQDENTVDGVYETLQKFLEDQPYYSTWATESHGTLSLGPSKVCDICQYEGCT